MPTKNETSASEHTLRSGRIARLRGVSHTYPGPVQALRDLHFELEQGTLTVLIGANGSGKSTLLRILAAMQTPSHGDVEILGRRLPFKSRWFRWSRRSEERHVRSQIAFISQNLALDPEMTGKETLRLLAALYGVPPRQRSDRIADLVEAFGLSALLPRLVQTYSGGQRRRLHVAAGMLADPPLLLLDEPTAGLDAESSTLVWKELTRRVQRGHTVVLVSHDLVRTQEYADRVAVLHQGQCLAYETPDALTGGKSGDGQREPSTEPALARVYRALTGQDRGKSAGTRSCWRACGNHHSCRLKMRRARLSTRFVLGASPGCAGSRILTPVLFRRCAICISNWSRAR